MRRTSVQARPAVEVGPALVAVMLVVTVVVMSASWMAPLVPVERGEGWALVQEGLGVNAPRTVPSWWMVVLFAAVALASHAQALAVWRRGGANRVVAVAWWAIGLAMMWISVDHALAVHESAPSLGGAGLPGPLAERPVEAVLLLVLVPAGLVALVGGTWAQRLLLPTAGILYVTGQVGVGGGFLELGLSSHRTAVVEATLQLAGALAVLAAASARREVTVS